MSSAAGMSQDKIAAVARWRDSDVFDERERLVLEYAEAMSQTPAEVAPELRASLEAELGRRGLAEITTVVAWEHFRARFNRAYGIEPQGLSACVLPQHRQA